MNGCGINHSQGVAMTRPGLQIIREFRRFLIAGSIAFGVDLAVLVTLKELLGIEVLIANLFSFACGLSTIYLLSVHWVYERRVLKQRAPEFIIFTLLTLLGLVLNEVCLWGSTEYLGLHYALAKVLATGLTFLFNFSLRKIVLFR